MPDDDISFNDLIASAIHDMKNSLNMQICALEKIAMQCRQKGDVPTFDGLGTVIQQANGMTANLVQLLSLYKLGKDIYPVELAEHSVRQVIEDALLQNRSMLEFRGISLEVVCDDNLYWYLDRDLISGVLINALNNAYNYTQDKVRVRAATQEGYLEIWVEDNGPGYPQALLEDPDSQVDMSSNFTNGSTGLGVYFSRQAASVHKNGTRQGVVVIHNGGAYGGGCFGVRLP
jgi:signal transduction histidine kinase